MLNGLKSANFSHTQFDKSVQTGLKLAYLSAYNHNGEPHYSAIWYTDLNGDYAARHDMSPGKYQSEFDDLTGKGYGLELVTACGVNNQHVFAAKWSK